jgi:hypothetical protein
MVRLREIRRCGTVAWRSASVPVQVRFSSLSPEPTGHLECDQHFPIGLGLPLRLDDGSATLVVIVGPDNQFLAVRPFE